MAYLNENYLKLQAGYLFPEIARRVSEFCDANPEAAEGLIRCGIGDVTEPLPRAVIDAMHRAVEETGHRETFRGYRPTKDTNFCAKQSRRMIIAIAGSRSPTTRFSFRTDRSPIAVIILDILGRAKPHRDHRPGLSGLRRYKCHGGPHRSGAEDRSLRRNRLFAVHGRQTTSCRSRPTNTPISFTSVSRTIRRARSRTREQLSHWVEYAREHEALLLFDAAYEAYISDPEIPHSIFEISGARECAVEFRSFSKNGGFTGVRCGFTVMPKVLLAQTEDGRPLPLHPLWHRRWSTKANSVSYPVQRGAEALYTRRRQRAGARS